MWSRKEQVLAIVGVTVHLILGWYVYDAHRQTPRIIQIIGCDGNIEFEGEIQPEKKVAKQQPLSI